MSECDGYCDICDINIEVARCCSGHDCGCRGQPTEPPVCKECAEKHGHLLYNGDDERGGYTYPQIIKKLRKELQSGPD